MSPLSAEYRSSASDSDSDNDNDQQEEEGEEAARGHAARAPPRRGPGGLTVTRALLDAFTASLDAHKVRLRFFAGGWASLRELLARPKRPPPPYDIVLASETIYRTDSLGAFLGVLRAATSAPVAVADVVAPCDREVVRPPLCLVAAKVLYFGVGGGVQGFVRAVEEEHGTVRTVWEHREGVGRVIMHIE
jgi:protein-histidine N-methyltransferase